MSYSLSVLKVLRVFVDDPSRPVYGLELIDRSGVKAGALYPILGRLEDEGAIRGEWEEIDEVAMGRRKRRYYQLTDDGAARAREVLSETADLLRPPPYSRRARGLGRTHIPAGGQA